MWTLLLSLALVAARAAAAEPPRSGLPVGAKVPVLEIVDPERTAAAGAPCCRIELGEGPALLAFVALGREGAALVDRVDALTRRYERATPPLSAAVVFMGGPEARPELERLLAERGWQVPVYYLTGLASFQRATQARE